MFLVLKCDICNFADNNTIYSCNKLLSKILANLQLDLNVLTWFTVNSLSPNPGKFQYVVLGKCIMNQLSLFINAMKMERTSEAVLLGITIVAGKCYQTDRNLFLFACLYLFTSGKLEIDMTYVTSLYSEHIFTRCYYLYSLTPLTLLELVGIY